MTARCGTCSINYPSHYGRCQVCDEPLEHLADGYPHDDWQARVHKARSDASRPRTTGEQVEDWRLEQLLRAGYPLDDAEQLARRPWHEVDLHQALDLAEAGCPPELAAAILR